MPKKKKTKSKTENLKESCRDLTLLDKIKLLSQILENIGEELILLNREGQIVYANRAATEGLGFSLPVLLKKKITDFFKEKININEWKERYFTELKGSKRPVQYEFERLVKGGNINVVEVKAVYFADKSGEYILSIGRDVTKKVVSQRAQRDYDKMIALNVFVAGTTQEIKYPLDVVLTQLQFVIKKYGNRDFEYLGYKEFKKMMDMIKNINSQIIQCCDIADKMILFNKKRLGTKITGSNANQIIQKLVDQASEEFRSSDVRVSMRLAKELPPLAINETDLNRVVSSIIANAMQAMPSGGKLFIKTYHRKTENRVFLEFKDNGIGIPKEILPRVFEPFFTTKYVAAGHASGLGLSVVYSIVREAKGEINIKSNLRQGTLIKVRLPMLRNNSSQR